MDTHAPCVALIGLDDSRHLVVTACNDRFFELLGETAVDTQIFPIRFDALVADSTQRELREKLLACFSAGSPARPEHIHDVRNGGSWWRLSLKPIKRQNGDACADEVLVTGFDMVAQSQPAQAPEADASRYRALVDLAYDAIVTMDEQHNITLFNRAAENLFGYSSAEILGQPIVTLLPERFRAGHPHKVKQFADAYQPTLRQATPPRMDETNSVYGQHRDGSIVPVEIAVSKISFNGGVEFMAVVRDITDRARLMELLKKQAVTDALTGLPNRRAFLEFVQKLFGTTDLFSVFILDIDFFKKINDQYGHDVGDEVLRALAKIGESITTRPCLFARWGGEEFVAALPGADVGLAQSIANTLRQRIERRNFEHVWRVKPVAFTVSIGVVTREADEIDVDTLMRRADQALYRAKKSGRNRVETG
ncbi:sensor domain-containing diguanylate cyclase [Paraburkholderia tropica]|nr:diguanylate cyclase [Paraburkholderia tropica]